MATTPSPAENPDSSEIRRFHIEEYKILFENYHKKNQDVRILTQVGITGLSVTYGWLLTKGPNAGFFSSMVWIIPIVISYIVLQYNIGLRRTMDVDRIYLKKIENFFAGKPVTLEGRENFFDLNSSNPSYVYKGINLFSREFKIWSCLFWISVIAFVLRMGNFFFRESSTIPDTIRRILNNI